MTHEQRLQRSDWAENAAYICFLFGGMALLAQVFLYFDLRDEIEDQSSSLLPFLINSAVVLLAYPLTRIADRIQFGFWWNRPWSGSFSLPDMPKDDQ